MAKKHPIFSINRKLLAVLDAADRRIDEGAGIGHEKFWQEVEADNRSREGNGNGKKLKTKRSCNRVAES